MLQDIDSLRERGMRLIVYVNVLCSAVIAAVMLALAARQSWLPVMIGLAANVMPVIMVARHRHDEIARLLVGAMAVVNPALLVYAMQGNLWQMDMHMFFFVSLASLAMLCDWRPILLASALIAVHHLLLDFFAPEWVFTGSGDLSRVGIHVVAVLSELCALVHLTDRLRAVLLAQGEARRAAEDASINARAAQSRAEEALAATAEAEARAAAERARRESLEREASATRERELITLASQFEGSVHGIVNSVGTAAEQLEGAARALNDLAQDSGRQSAAVATRASESSEAARAVAGGIAELSRSIIGIAASVEQQAELTGRARVNFATGDKAVRALADQTTNIAEFTGRIETIASRTNLLALNATIEAARAGDAGRGFAVVATEVKTLATQTARATSEISDMIDDVHGSARVAEGSLRDVSDVVGELSDAADAIRTMLTEQRRTAELIERNAGDTARGADDMAERIEQVAIVANEAGHLSDQVRGAASDLLDQSVALQSATRTFVERLRAA